MKWKDTKEQQKSFPSRANLEEVGLSSAEHIQAVVPAVRYKSGTRPAHNASPGFSLPSGSPSIMELNSAKNTSLWYPYNELPRLFFHTFGIH
jgi:hypothetical protein